MWAPLRGGGVLSNVEEPTQKRMPFFPHGNQSTGHLRQTERETMVQILRLDPLLFL